MEHGQNEPYLHHAYGSICAGHENTRNIWKHMEHSGSANRRQESIPDNNELRLSMTYVTASTVSIRPARDTTCKNPAIHQTLLAYLKVKK
jgi:hypothetical protein